MTEILPSWVESERVGNAADPLGMQHITDWFSDQLLPGLSGTAKRARYFSFLCWAYNEYEGNKKNINKWQPKIAEQEKLRRDKKLDGRFNGIIGIRDGSKTETTLTGSYGQTMVNIGLLNDDKKTLSNDGDKLLSKYAEKGNGIINKDNKVVDTKLISANMYNGEKAILKKMLGMDKRIKGKDELEKRKQTWCLLAKHANLGWASAKAEYMKKKAKPRNEHERMLWFAVHWSAVVEYLEKLFLIIHSKEEMETKGCDSVNVLQPNIKYLEEVSRGLEDLEVFMKLAQKKRKISEAIYSRHCEATGNPWIDKKGKLLAGSPRLDKWAATPSFRIPVFYSLAEDLGMRN